MNHLKKSLVKILFLSLMIILASACSPSIDRLTRLSSAPEWQNAISASGVDAELIQEIESNPIYEITPLELDQYLKFIHAYIPDLRERISYLAHRFLDQPYEIYLLGEFPFEIYDTQPLFSLGKSDCVVFSEHVYAMAFSKDWKMFFGMLQRIRYKDGEIGYTTRNHYTEADWIVNNSWFLNDLTSELAGEKTISLTTEIDRKKFFTKSGIMSDVAVQELNWNYIPAAVVQEVLSKLKTGDFVNVVRGTDEKNVWVGHVGLVIVDPDGTVNFLHSTPPMVKKQTILSYMEDQSKKVSPKFMGFKFLRLNEDPVESLKKIDGPRAPKLQIYGK